jgi:hypothetical protein
MKSDECKPLTPGQSSGAAKNRPKSWDIEGAGVIAYSGREFFLFPAETSLVDLEPRTKGFRRD